MAVIRLPTVLRRLASDTAEVAVEGATVQAAMTELAEAHPLLGAQLMQDGAIRPFVRVFVGADDIQSLQGPDTPLQRADVLRIVPAIAGGSECSGGEVLRGV